MSSHRSKLNKTEFEAALKNPGTTFYVHFMMKDDAWPVKTTKREIRMLRNRFDYNTNDGEGQFYAYRSGQDIYLTNAH